MKLLICLLLLSRVGVAANLEKLLPSSSWEHISVQNLKQYEELWVISDIHGQAEYLTSLLKASELAKGENQFDLHWNEKATKQLLIVVGDLIDKGPDGVGVVRLLTQLREEAPAHKSRVLLLLGNHEVEYLGKRHETVELYTSANIQKHKDWLLSHSSVLKGQVFIFPEIRASRFGDELRSFPMGALIGDWLFVHSGYFEADKKAEIEKYFGKLNELRVAGDFEKLSDPDGDYSSILLKHNWWKRNNFNGMLKRLKTAGIAGVVMGHDPDALTNFCDEALGSIAILKAGWLVKIDTGMSVKASDSKGLLMKCEVSRLLGKNNKLTFLSEKGIPNCEQLDSKEGILKIPVCGN